MGSWQIIRLNWKNNLILEIESSLKKPPVQLSETNVTNFLKIKTSGSIDFDKQIYLYNLNENGTPGFEVINPIIIDSKNYLINSCLLYTSPSPRDATLSRMPSSA